MPAGWNVGHLNHLLQQFPISRHVTFKSTWTGRDKEKMLYQFSNIRQCVEDIYASTLFTLC